MTKTLYDLRMAFYVWPILIIDIETGIDGSSSTGVTYSSFRQKPVMEFL